MRNTPDFQPVFTRLRALLEPYAPYLTVTHDSKNLYYLDGPYSQEYKRVLFFGSAQK